MSELSPRPGPRERLCERGAEFLDDAALLALLLRTGAPGRSAEVLARELLREVSLHALARALPAELERIPGVGPAKAAGLLAALELGRRVSVRRLATGDAIRGPEDVFRHLHPRLRDAHHEQFHLLLLDGRHRLLRDVMASAGDAHRQPGAPPRGLPSRAARGGGRPGGCPQSSERGSQPERRGSGGHPAPGPGRCAAGRPAARSCGRC